MDSDLAQKAISAALQGNWTEAIKLNLAILKKSSRDIDALNRLARAYAENSNLNKARITCAKALKIDPTNNISVRAMAKWKSMRGNGIKNTCTSASENFLEEPGKTKIFSLIHLGDNKLISKLDSGDEVKLDTHSHRVSVHTNDNKYIGRLPDDLSARLRKFIAGGNEYRVIIKCIEPDSVKVFIKETKNTTDVPSFPTEKIEYTSFTPPELVHKNDMVIVSDDEE